MLNLIALLNLLCLNTVIHLKSLFKCSKAKIFMFPVYSMKTSYQWDWEVAILSVTMSNIFFPTTYKLEHVESFIENLTSNTFYRLYRLDIGWWRAAICVVPLIRVVPFSMTRIHG